MDAILWVRQQATSDYGGDQWIREYADINRCFLMGGSAGANITYNACLRAICSDMKPMKMAGLILNQPFFAGIDRTESELRLENDIVLPLVVADLMWELALPIGADRDHEFANPLVRGTHDKMFKHLPSCLVRSYEEDPLVDRGRALVKMLESHGVHVTSKFREGGMHAAEVFDPTKVQVLLDDVKEFISATDVEKEQSHYDSHQHIHKPCHEAKSH